MAAVFGLSGDLFFVREDGARLLYYLNTEVLSQNWPDGLCEVRGQCCVFLFELPLMQATGCAGKEHNTLQMIIGQKVKTAFSNGTAAVAWSVLSVWNMYLAGDECPPLTNNVQNRTNSISNTNFRN